MPNLAARHGPGHLLPDRIPFMETSTKKRKSIRYISLFKLKKNISFYSF